MDTFLKQLKDVFPNKAIIIIDKDSILPEDAIGIIFSKETECEEISILDRPILLNKTFINITTHKYLAISKSMPPRIQMLNPGENFPRNHCPIASWDGKNINLAIPKTISDPFIKTVLTSSLPMLVYSSFKQDDFMQLCEGMSLGIEKEAKDLKRGEEANRKTGEEYLIKANEYLEKADRQARIIDQLQTIEKSSAFKTAKQQWEDISELIPRALQNIYIKDEYIHALTVPQVLLGNFMGTYIIQVHIKSGEIKIFGVTEGINTQGHSHPHIQDNGSICWGSLSNQVAELKSSRDYFGLISAGLRLLASYNRDSQYVSLSKWGNNFSGNDSETTKSDCRERGPNYSLAQAKKCMKCKASDSECKYKKYNSEDIYKSCFSRTTSKDCVQCEETNCPNYILRFDRCWSLMEKQGPAWCMLRCSHINCPHKHTAQQQCSIANKRSDGTCPASDKCWMSCVLKEE
jgi:hypothetical protein